ncbi:glycerophosphoryl diester phosphodiesterase membrane domain-containing protein [Paenibacillus daejeonensis]|uniref:glycerophosphoryl diester phosphodiesterase membrane domain-containing protein n=1 Tax=Paenibacillus daejeonensis TaxID=135193 RepID=UPI0003816AE1|nr:glycerophosphoryl diester phosphodiesterase membrane domain-containing protein [Paenibacillus daejeonensis]
MTDLLRYSLTDFRRSYKKHVTFALLFLVMTSYLFIPLISYIFNRMMRAISTGSLLNGEIYRIALSYQGIGAVLAISLVAMLVLFLQLGVVLVIAQKVYFRKDILIADAFITILRRTPALFSFGTIQLMLYFLFLLPFIESPLSASVLSKVNLQIYFTTKLSNGSYILLGLYIVLLIVFIYYILRWLFSLHFIIIEGQSTRQAIRSSLELTRGNRIRILLQLVLFNAVVLLAGFGIVSLVNYLTSLIPNSPFSFFINDYMLTISGFLAYMAALLLIPINMIFMTRMFYRLHARAGRLPEDRLHVYRMRWLRVLEVRVARLFRTRKRKLLIVVGIPLYLLVSLGINYYVNDNLLYLKWNVQIAGHRGDLHSAPENSMSSIRSAIDKKIDAVEIDVQMTKDGVIVLNHDYTLNRVAGVPESVHNMNYADLAVLDIGRRFSSVFAGERIPTLEEVLIETQDQVKLIIEMKPYGDGREMAAKVVELIEAYDRVDSCYIQSFDNSLLRTVRDLNPDIKLGQILFIAAGNLSTIDVDFYTIEQSMLSQRFIDHAHRNGREVWLWTVNVERNIREVLKYKIDGIITDYPEKVQSIIGVGVE